MSSAYQTTVSLGGYWSCFYGVFRKSVGCGVKQALTNVSIKPPNRVACYYETETKDLVVLYTLNRSTL